jgi:hypothetical protein
MISDLSLATHRRNLKDIGATKEPQELSVLKNHFGHFLSGKDLLGD